MRQRIVTKQQQQQQQEQQQLQKYSIKDPSIPRSVLLTLFVFTVLMFTLPIAVYFVTLHRVFNGESTYSAICAVVTANVILCAYVVMSFMEDSVAPASKVANSLKGKDEKKES